LDSMVVGEPQILGQVKDAYDMAAEGSATGLVLNRFMHKAFSAAKRVRTETRIAQSAVSVSFAAVELARKIFGGLERYPVLVIGAGDTGATVARHFAEAKPKLLTIVNRTFDRAQELAEELGGRARPWEDLDEGLIEARVIVTATGARGHVIDTTRMSGVLKRSSRGPKVMVDIANPRDVHPEVGKLDRVFLYDIDALESIADQNRIRRRREIPKVEGIVMEEADRFVAWYESLDMVPVIRALRGRFQEIAEKEMERQVKNFDPADQEALKEYTRSLLNKLLHQPTTLIRGVAPSTRHGIHKLVAIQELFELDLEPFQDQDRKEEGGSGEGMDPGESGAGGPGGEDGP